MAWENSTRRSRLPEDWPKRRKRVWRRDHGLCQVIESGELCGMPAADVDHIEAGDDHSLSNLRCICEWHHDRKSGSEGAQALARKKRQIRNSFRRNEAHPGLL